ncbi:hypothetical protein [Bradyrhizobium sacchari]|uniref:hypothetical protein n=1 Tax=Bradyrhizobium sacchari TaxID=1399419 RepID=UPI0010A96D55|nr:hypothetical protein [Bradyrhizobium sacchari]
MIVIAMTAAELFNSARFVVARCNAEMRIADQDSRIGRHSQAESTYEGAINAIQEALRESDIPAERADLWKLNRSLVVRWLGAVRMLTTTLDEKKAILWSVRQGGENLQAAEQGCCTVGIRGFTRMGR